jgi:hypothetical protein
VPKSCLAWNANDRLMGPSCAMTCVDRPFDVPAHRPLPCCKFCPCLPRWCRETPKPTFAYQDDTKPRNGEAQQCNPVYITRPADLPPNGQYFEHASAIQRTSIDAAEEKNALDTVETFL